MIFSSVYPHDVNKIEKKERTKAELHEVIEWLTGFVEQTIARTRDAPHQETDFDADGPDALARRHKGPGDGRDHLVRRSRP